MVRTDDLERFRRKSSDPRGQLVPLDDMALHDGPFLRRETARFPEDLIRDAEFPEVMQVGTLPQLVEVSGVQSEVFAKLLGHGGNAVGVATGFEIPGLEDDAEGQHARFQGGADFTHRAAEFEGVFQAQRGQFHDLAHLRRDRLPAVHSAQDNGGGHLPLTENGRDDGTLDTLFHHDRHAVRDARVVGAPCRGPCAVRRVDQAGPG
ncbi:hypothetical protein DEMA109039_22635 [Deinococcus marmoris]